MSIILRTLRYDYEKIFLADDFVLDKGAWLIELVNKIKYVIETDSAMTITEIKLQTRDKTNIHSEIKLC